MTEKSNFTNSKRDQILSLLGVLKFEEHTFEDKGYEFLEVDAIFISVYNPNDDTKLSIELGEDFKLYFSGWCDKYKGDENGYSLFCNALNGILSSILSVYVLELEEGTKYELAENVQIKDIKEVAILIPAFKKYRLKNAKLRIYAWKNKI